MSDRRAELFCFERRSHFKQAAARDLRAEATDFERTLWAHLRGKRFAQLRLRRQQPIGPYIADFYCSAAKLIIELDGSQHGAAEKIASDMARTKWLEARGYRVLRFSNHELLKHRDDVLEAIWRVVSDRARPSPKFADANFDPPSRGG